MRVPPKLGGRLRSTSGARLAAIRLPGNRFSLARVPDPVEGGEVLGVGVGQGVEVFLGGGDLGVTQCGP